MSIPPTSKQVRGPAIHVRGLEKSYDKLRERGWARWTRLERLAERPD